MKTIVSLVFGTILLLANAAYAEQTETEVVVYRSPSCGCCGKWIEHLRENNFNVKEIAVDDMSVIKKRYGVPNNLASCHTALVDGYVVEGHVPASDIKALLSSKAKINGIAVPGMPTGSPGMEMGGRK
ncbi:MAG: DUF411 domain-containing protein, partial [Gammaproteobacteria bacterium]